MRNIVGGLIQMSNPINDAEAPVSKIRDAMIDKHMPFIEEAGKRGVQILGLQEMFNGPYFCPSQDAKWCDIAEPIPGPTIELMQPIAKKYAMVMVVPIYEREIAGVYYNAAAVIDADGLNALAKNVSVIKECEAPLILTPHIGELSRLNGVPVSEIDKDKVKHASDFAGEYNCVLVFKGAPTIISEPGGQTYVNPTGNAGMATAGSGDVLTGIIAGLLAQKLMLKKGGDIKQITLHSALAGVYLHGLTGDLAKEEKGEMGMIAGDMMEKIPAALLRTVNGWNGSESD